MSEDITIAIEQNGVIYENEKFVKFKLSEKDKEIERLNNIIKEAREYIKDYELYYDEELGLVEMMGAGSTRTPVIKSTPLLEILDKVEENK